MATSSTPSIRKVLAAELSIICSALELQAKSSERAARASSNSVISDEYVKQSAMCRNLITEIKVGALDF